MWWTSHGFTHVHHFLTRPLVLFTLGLPLGNIQHEAPHPGTLLIFATPALDMSLFQTSDFPFKKTNFEHTCCHSPGSPGLISTIYAILNACAPLSAISYVGHWKCATYVNPEDWSKARLMFVKCSFNTHILESAYKVLFKLYWVLACIIHATLIMVRDALGAVDSMVMSSIFGGYAYD